MGRLRINQSELIARLKAGERDFTGASLVGPIDTSLGDLGDLGDLVLDGTFVIGDCFLGDITANSISLVGSHGNKRFGFYRPKVRTFHCERMQHGWFTITGGTVEGINFMQARFRTGLLIKNTPLRMLILDQCRSPYTPFDETHATSMTKFGADLGRREPMMLGEHFHSTTTGDEAAA